MSFVEYLQSIDPAAIIQIIQDISIWVLDGIESVLTSFITWIGYVTSSVGRLVGYATGFGSVFQSVINALPSVYLDLIVLAVTLTIIFVFYKRAL